MKNKGFKKLYSTIAATAVLFASVFSIGAVFKNTPDSIFIRSSEDVYKFREHLEGYFVIKCSDLYINLDLWTPLGTSERPFTGTIEGNGVNINFSGDHLNWEQDKNNYFAGFIGFNSGHVLGINFYFGKQFSLSLESECDFGYLGLISAFNYGEIRDCRVYGAGSIALSSTYDCVFGTIVGVNAGTILECESALNWSSFGNGKNLFFGGGVSGKNIGGRIEETAVLSKTVTISDFSKAYCGGITASIEKSNNFLKNCCSELVIYSSCDSNYLSSIAGISYGESESEFIDCYAHSRIFFIGQETICSGFIGIQEKKISSELLENYDFRMTNCYSQFYFDENYAGSSHYQIFSFSNAPSVNFENCYYSNSNESADETNCIKKNFEDITLSDLKWDSKTWKKDTASFSLV